MIKIARNLAIDDARSSRSRNSNKTETLTEATAALPADKQYQLWGIIAGKPVSAGTYDAHDTPRSLQQMASLKDVEMFAITIEPAGGSEQPTLDQMVVAGKLL